MYIPDEAKGDIVKFFSSQSWQVLLIAWKARAPGTPTFAQQLHTVACQYAYREGFLAAIEELSKIPHESDQNIQGAEITDARREQILTDPKD